MQFITLNVGHCTSVTVKLWSSVSNFWVMGSRKLARRIIKLSFARQSQPFREPNSIHAPFPPSWYSFSADFKMLLCTVVICLSPFLPFLISHTLYMNQTDTCMVCH